MTPADGPRELVLASAGTGKTFRISNRIVGLLARGAAPEAVLASTFTRKAAGEILYRVVRRLAEAALDDEAAAELSRHAGLAGGEAGDGLDRAGALRLLSALVRALHRLEVGTLDSLFVRTARSFTLELGMPPGWTISDTPTERRLRSEAVQDVLEDGDLPVLVELVRMLARGEAARSVHERLVRQMDVLHGIHRELLPRPAGPGAPAEGGSGGRPGHPPDPWSPFGDFPDVEDPEGARGALADRLAAVEAPVNKDGTPDSRWAGALEDAVERLRAGDWEAFWSGGPPNKWLEGEPTYYGKEFPEGMEACLREARELARASLGRELDRQARAMGRLVRRYDRALEARQRSEGTYRFRDVTHHLAGPDRVTGRPDLGHRLDRRIGHVLLDEFQDTSRPQWDALRPLVEAVASGEGGADGALVVVADPKQSIYGWRGADPDLPEQVGDRYRLAEHRLDRSWRSSPVVLEFVNDLFRGLSENPVVEGTEWGREVAGRWAAAFDEHRPAPPLQGAPGHVRVEAGPRDPGRGTDRPRLMARAADRVAALHREAPGAGIGVLTRTNRAVARLIHELRRRGIEASEEGGTSVDDAAPVAAVLALLRLADHPGHGVARYHVAATPLGEAVGYTDHGDAAGARRLALRVRRRLLREGYGPVLSDWTRRLAPRVDAGELRRLDQLVELGFRWEERATLRPGDFVRFVESERVEDPLSAPVRVMTIHQAKGLEFDVVVLPELDVSLLGRGGGAVALPERDRLAGGVRRVFPYVKGDLRPLFPEVGEAERQRRAARLRDGLSLLYVAVTRARHALHLLVSSDPESGPGEAKSFARLVRGAFGLEERRIEDGDVLLERGDPEWHRTVVGTAAAQAPEAPAAPEVRVDTSAPRRRIFSRRTPSELEGGGRVEMADVLKLGRAEALRRGGVVHRWCEEIRWIEKGLPGEDRLRSLALEEAPEMGPRDLDDLLERFRGWMEAPSVRAALSREEAGARIREGTGAQDVRLEVVTERSFAFRDGDEVFAGAIDRLVLAWPADEPPGPDAGEEAAPGEPFPLAAEVTDFKSDEVPPGAEEALEERTAHYRPQLRAYRRAVATLYRLDPDDVQTRLVFLEPGVVREVG